MVYPERRVGLSIQVQTYEDFGIIKESIKRWRQSGLLIDETVMLTQRRTTEPPIFFDYVPDDTGRSRVARISTRTIDRLAAMILEGRIPKEHGLFYGSAVQTAISGLTRLDSHIRHEHAHHNETGESMNLRGEIIEQPCECPLRLAKQLVCNTWEPVSGNQYAEQIVGIEPLSFMLFSLNTKMDTKGIGKSTKLVFGQWALRIAAESDLLGEELFDI